MKDAKECPKKYCIIKVLAVFIFYVLYDKVLHHHLLTNLYQQSAQIWRSKEEMAQLLPWLLGRDFLLSLLIVCFYGKCRRACMAECSGSDAPCPFKHGICFGVSLGLFMALILSRTYFYMPISLELATAWFMATVVKGIGIGFILGAISACKMQSCSKK